MLPDRSVLIEQKLVENAKIPKFKCDILSNFQTLCRWCFAKNHEKFIFLYSVETEGEVLTDNVIQEGNKTSLSTKIQNLANEFLEGSWRPELSSDLPKHWEKHDDLIIFPINAFQDPIWNSVSCEFWTSLIRLLQVQRLAKKSVISNDDFRSPQIQMLLGQNTWATKKENGIYYTWNITKSMFSVGNISEKQRIGNVQL